MNKQIYKYKRFWLILLMFAYLILGYTYPPKIIYQQLSTQLSKHLNMQANITALRFNPLTFNTEIEGLELTDSNQKIWFKSKLVSVNFDPMNLIWGEWKFSDLNLVNPQITIQTDEAGQVVVPALPDMADSKNNDKVIDFSIEQIHLSQGRMNLQADNIKENFNLNIKSFEIIQEKFILTDEDSHFEIKITTENDESVVLAGSYNHVKQLIDSEIEFIDWQASTLNQVLPDDLNLQNHAGTIQAKGHIDWLLSKKPLLEFSNIELQSLQSNWQSDVTTKNLSANIQRVKIDTEIQTVNIESIESNQGEWHINWPLTDVSGQNNHSESPTTRQTDQSMVNEIPGWQITVNQISCSNWSVNLIDDELNANLPFKVQSLDVFQINNLSSKFTFESQINFVDQGVLNINDAQLLPPLTVTADINLHQFQLQQISPWVTAMSDLTITQGQLSTQQRLILKDEHFELTGNLTIEDGNINDQDQQPIANWGTLKIGATSLSSRNKTIVLDQISLDQASGSIPTDSDQTTLGSLKNEQNSDSTDWTITIGGVNTKDSNTKLID